MKSNEFRQTWSSRFRSWTESCCYCHSWIPPVYGLCSYCWSVVDTRQAPKKRHLEEYPFVLYSLWNWHPKDELMTSFLHYLKGGYTDFLADQLAKRLFTHRLDQSAFRWKSYLIAAVPSRSGKEDHASLLAQKLSGILGCPLHEGLYRKDLEAQKLRSARNRNLIEFGCKRGLRPSLPIILIDDVATTGATARACWKALGSPRSFEVWTLACRPKINLL